MKKMELLAPAGDLERLEAAVEYGADAVYFGGESLSLRSGGDFFTPKDMAAGVEFAHKKGVRCYLAMNVFAHNEDLEAARETLGALGPLGLDGLIVSDPGILTLAKELLPDVPLHLSTQANTTNVRSAAFWHEQGVKRIVLARELSLEEIRQIRAGAPESLELEAFVHGAMCMSYSGRCLLSNFLTGRDANRGNCAHPCRYRYALVEEKRPGEYYPVGEDARGSYILNADDLCMIRHIPALAQAGLSSLKIEGRKKSTFYVAAVTGAYRKALDAYYADPDGYVFREEWMEGLSLASHRNFSTGFYFGPPGPEDQNYRSSGYSREGVFAGVVRDYDAQTGLALVEQRNKMVLGDEIHVFGPKTPSFTFPLMRMEDLEGNALTEAPHPQQLLRIPAGRPVRPMDILYLRKES